jgi:hypothetical protein
MPAGSEWQVYVPSDLAYHDDGDDTDIAPGETLIFDIELLSINNNRVPLAQWCPPLMTLKEFARKYKEEHPPK